MAYATELQRSVRLRLFVSGLKASIYSITERRVPELIPVLGSQPAGDVSHKPGGRLPLLSARPAVTPATLESRYQFCCVNSLPKTVTRQRRGCDLNPGPTAPESSTLTTRLPSQKTIGAIELQKISYDNLTINSP